MIDGSFRLAALRRAGRARLRASPSCRPTRASARTSRRTGSTASRPRRRAPKQDAAGEVPQFITTPAAMELVAREGGRACRPARRWRSATPIRNHPKYGAFIRGLALLGGDLLRQRDRAAEALHGHGRPDRARRPSRCRNRSRRRRPRSRSSWTRSSSRLSRRGLGGLVPGAPAPPSPMLDRLSLRARRTLCAWTFLAVPIAFYAAVRFYPTADALLTSLTDWNIVGPRRFVGLDNYRRLFADSDVLEGDGQHLPVPGRGASLSASRCPSSSPITSTGFASATRCSARSTSCPT